MILIEGGNVPKRRTHEEFNEEVIKKYGNEFTLIGRYKNKREKILVQHNPCGTKFEVYPNNFLKGYRCPGGCKQKRDFTPANKKTHEQFVNEVYNLVKDEYTVSSKYINNRTNILLLHNECKKEFPVTPKDFLRGNRCPYCSPTALKTTSKFKQEVFSLVGDEYRVLDSYKGAKVKINILHVSCGRSWEVTPSNFLSGTRCPECTKINQKKTHEQFVSDVYKKYGNDYKVISTYSGSKAEVTVLHTKCGKTYVAIPNYLLSGNQCPYCYGTFKKTTEKFKQELYMLRGDEYSVLGEYAGNSSPILIRHNICGYEWLPTPSNLLSRESRCPKCFGKIQLTHADFLSKVYDLVGNEYTPLTQYQSIMVKVIMRHNSCGFEYPVSPNDFLNCNRRCPKCNGGVKRTEDEYKQLVFESVGDEYTVLGEYINAHTKIETIHNKCGYTWGVRPADFLINGSRCPKCNESKGEISINNFLIQNNYIFERQFKFDECSYKRPLPFDFAVFHNEEEKRKGTPFCLIEYNGQQHYMPVDYFGGEPAFEEQKIRDNVKQDYCKKNQIPLLIIPYWNIDFIEDILIRELGNYQ
jgi:hypothetical protein